MQNSMLTCFHLVTQAGDWGYFVSNLLVFFPIHSLTIHADYTQISQYVWRETRKSLAYKLPCVSAQEQPPHCRPSQCPLFPRLPPPSFSQPSMLLSHLLSYIPFNSYTEQESNGIKRALAFRKGGAGYHAIQSTKPQTLGYSLADSPVGLLAWIYEKLVLAVDGYEWEDDEGLSPSQLKLALLTSFFIKC